MSEGINRMESDRGLVILSFSSQFWEERCLVSFLFHFICPLVRFHFSFVMMAMPGGDMKPSQAEAVWQATISICGRRNKRSSINTKKPRGYRLGVCTSFQAGRSLGFCG